MSMSHDEMIAVIQHHKNGGKVEYRSSSQNPWKTASTPQWEFAIYDYRPKPEPMVLWVVFIGGLIGDTFRHEDDARRHADDINKRSLQVVTLKKFVEVTE